MSSNNNGIPDFIEVRKTNAGRVKFVWGIPRKEAHSEAAIPHAAVQVIPAMFQENEIYAAIHRRHFDLRTDPNKIDILVTTQASKCSISQKAVIG